MFDHEKLDVYQVSLEFVTWSYRLSKQLKGTDRHARDQLIRASQSIPLNIAEGNGKRSLADRKRFLQIACGSALECAAILDVLFRCEVISNEDSQFGKKLLSRVVAMLTKMTQGGGQGVTGQVREDTLFYGYEQNEDEYESEYEDEDGK